MKATDMTAEDVYRMLYEIPSEVRQSAYWVMTKQDLDTLKDRLPFDGVGLPTRCVGKPIVLREDVDEVSLAYPANPGRSAGESALYRPCMDADCPAHRVGYAHGHRIEETR